MGNIAEHRPEQHQHERTPRHLAVDGHDHGRRDHEQDEGPAPAETVGDEPEGEVAEIGADL